MTDPTEKDELLREGPVMTPEGRLEGRIQRVEPPPAPTPAPQVEEPLELMPRPPKVIEERVERYREDLRARNRKTGALKAVVGFVALAVIGFVALLRFQPDLRRTLPDGVRESTFIEELTRAPDAEPVIISSSPPGADIVIGGKRVGQTPWAGENRWQGETKVVLQLAGYRQWEGKLNGGKAQAIDVQLKQ